MPLPETQPEINCHNCEGACCQGGTIELTMEEAAFMLRGGNKLRTIAQPVDYDRDEVFCPGASITDPDTGEIKEVGTLQPLRAGLGRYVMDKPCVFLEVNAEGWVACGVYEERPETCQRFEVGGLQCVLLRQIYGVDEMTPETEQTLQIIERKTR